MVPGGDAGHAPRFVVQEHHARRLHWDLRLERDGVLASWAVPRGIPPGPERNHLAVRTEDHPLEYLEFHGEIPAGQYGAGTMTIWDHGTYETHKFRDDEVMVTFHGERVRGKYVLFRTRGDDWMIHRMDPPEDPDRVPMPERLEPMLARTGPLPPDDGRWAYEIKWDGVRAIAFVQGGTPDAAGALRARRQRPLPRAAPARRRAGGPRGRARRRGRRVRRRASQLPEAAEPHAPHLRRPGPAARPAGPGPLHRLRPALPRRPLAARAPLRRAPRGARRARARRPDLAGPRPPRRRRRGAARGDPRAAARGHRGQAPGLPLHAGPALLGLGEGQEHRQHRRGRRRLAGGGGRPLGPARRARDRHPRRGRRPALRRPRRHGLHRDRARRASSACSTTSRRTPRRSPAASRRSSRTSSSRGWWPASTSRSGRTRARCASRPTRGCATTWRPRTCASGDCGRRRGSPVG